MGNRERLVRAAAALFREEGYAHTSVADLLARTGVARSNFYYHFDSKLDLAREMVSRWAASYRDAVAAHWEDAASDSERRRSLYRSLRGGDGRDLPGPPTAALALELAPHDHEIRASVREVVDDLESRLAVTMADAGPPGDGPSPGVTLAAVSALLGAIVVDRAVGEADVQRCTGDGLDRLLAGCGGGPAPESGPRARDGGAANARGEPCSAPSAPVRPEG